LFIFGRNLKVVEITKFEFTVVNGLEKWECVVCGYIYDPSIGDLEHGVQPGTAFEALPENWVCPVCGAPKDQFVKKNERTSSRA